MDTRNVQQTGEMFYLYLPTKWCKRFNISNKSKVGIQPLADGSLAVFPQGVESKPINLSFKVSNEHLPNLHKLIIASYISPATSFKITLEKDIDFTKTLEQKNMASLELVEIDGNKIICESSLQVQNPLSLLTTMIRKVCNLLLILSKNQQKEHEDLLIKYEEEIDRSKLLIEKAVISGLVNITATKLKSIELYFISLMSKELERIVDHLITLKKPEEAFMKKVSGILNEVQKLLRDNCKDLNYQSVMPLLQKIENLQGVKVKDVTTYSLRRIVRSLNSVSEVLVDWSVMKEAEKVQ